MRKGGDSSHTRASLVFENNRLESQQLGSRCHRRKHRYGFMGLFRRSFTNRGPNVLQLEEECCITCSDKFSHQPPVQNWTAVLSSTGHSLTAPSNTLWRPWTETHWWMFSFVFPFFSLSFFSPKRAILKWDSTYRKDITKQTSKRYFQILIKENIFQS